MALTIGACTAIFSIVHAVLLSPLPYTDAERLVIIWHTQPNAAGVVGMSPRDYETYRDTTRAFESVAAVSTRGYNWSNGAEPSRIICGRVTSTAFPMLGVAPLRGRWFSERDDHVGADRVVLLSEEVWRTRMGGREEVLGSSVALDGNPYTVIGVMPASFAFPPEGVQGLGKADCWVPAAFSAAELNAPAFDNVVFAKRTPHVSTEQVASDAAAVAQRIWDAYPAALQKQVKLRARVVPLAVQVVATSQTAVLVFAAAAACLLLLGCANVANLTLARLQARQRELAIRTAMGATRWSLMKLLLIESVVLAVCGGAIGAMFASALLRLVVAMSPGNVPRLDQAHVDSTALLFATACAVCAGLLCGFAPSLRAGRSAIAGGLEAARGSSSAGLGRDRVQVRLGDTRARGDHRAPDRRGVVAAQFLTPDQCVARIRPLSRVDILGRTTGDDLSTGCTSRRIRSRGPRSRAYHPIGQVRGRRHKPANRGDRVHGDLTQRCAACNSGLPGCCHADGQPGVSQRLRHHVEAGPIVRPRRQGLDPPDRPHQRSHGAAVLGQTRTPSASPCSGSLTSAT